MRCAEGCAGRGVLGRRRVLCALALAWSALSADVTFGVELEDVFPGYRAAETPVAAETLVRSALGNLFDVDVALFVEGETVREGQAPAEIRFWSYRKHEPDGTHKVFLATLEPDGREGVRLLQVDRDRTRSRAWVYSPEASSDPVRTDYRLTDPFLGTFSDLDPAEIRANLSGLRSGYEILGRESVDGGGSDLHRMTLRSLATRAYERLELVVATRPERVLAFEFFEGPSPEAARTILAPRESFVSFEGRLLPGRLLYTDRLQRTKTRLRVRYLPIPKEVGEAPFLEFTFHEVPLPEALAR